MSGDLKEECRPTMLHKNMNISPLIVHAQQVKEEMVKRKSGDSSREKSFNDGSSQGRLYIQGKPRLQKSSSNQVPSMFPNAREDMMSNPNPKKGRGTSTTSTRKN